ncbi:MAG: valine--tRNA ligase [Deltaproteobacteria bacterium]|nr:valine--tRNA ligase [Deltaproteobacteria bacterium]
MFRVRLGDELEIEEEKIYATWLENHCFTFSRDQKYDENFIFVLPPPNANGELHLGHSFGYTIMDCIGRFQRQLGKNVLLLPGKDHAGIQTQVIFEKLLRDQGIDTTTLTREELYKRCYEFCIDRANYMRSQEKSLGLGADWNFELFTLDPRVSEIVLDTFIKLYEQGYAYRAERIVNWSIVSNTSISDIEVEHVEKPGTLFFIVYPWSDDIELEHEGDNYFDLEPDDVLNDAFLVKKLMNPPKRALIKGRKCVLHPVVKKLKSEEFLVYLPEVDLHKGITVATTRPETMLGDTAVAVNPDDVRYKNLIGREVTVPCINRKVSIIASPLVDPTYGTGALKVTPAHDFKDFEIAKQKNLQIVQVIGKDGLITQNGGKYCGLTIQQARQAVINDLKEEGLLVDTKEIVHFIPVSERAKDVIEPLVTDQWWIKVESLKEEALRRVKNKNELEVFPEEFRSLIIQWFERLEDWNVSRQLWWGHRIPAWYQNGDVISVSREVPDNASQDPDTFDTWFSSGQWAYSTLVAHNLLDLTACENWSHNYPTHLMVMGRDILFFWACRMILLGLYRTNRIPFKKLYFHGLILDEKGQKMSKSRGNGIEPKEVQSKYGTDVLRLSLLNGFTPGRDIRFGFSKCEPWSRFLNKLYNCAKFIKLNSGPETATNIIHPLCAELIRSTRTKCEEYKKGFEIFELSSVLDNIYTFFWDTFCDWYIEISKVLLKTPFALEQKTALKSAFEAILFMFHPFAPFVTEYLHTNFLGEKMLLAKKRFSDLTCYKLEVANSDYDMLSLFEIVRLLRRFKQFSTDQVDFFVEKSFNYEDDIVASLSRCNKCQSSDCNVEILVRTKKVFIKIRDIPVLKKELQKRLDAVEAQLERIEKLLKSDFSSKAPYEVVLKEKQKYEQLKIEKHELENQFASISGK